MIKNILILLFYLNLTLAFPYKEECESYKVVDGIKECLHDISYTTDTIITLPNSNNFSINVKNHKGSITIG